MEKPHVEAEAQRAAPPRVPPGGHPLSGVSPTLETVQTNFLEGMRGTGEGRGW